MNANSSPFSPYLHPVAPSDPDEPLWAAMQRFQATQDLFSSGAVVAGVSGGADSVCLLHLLLHHVDLWNLDLHVAHLDHNLRPESGEDAAFVSELAARWGLPFHLRRLAPGELDGAGDNLEAAARNARYRFLADVARQVATHGPATVAVAHTADDQAETLLMHLLRGSGLAGLAGMRAYTRLQEDRDRNLVDAAPVFLVRPLLDVRRTEIVCYLKAHNLSWREDATNQDRRFTRNWLRHEILPRLAERNPNVYAVLARTAVILAAEADRAAQNDRAAFERLFVPSASVEGERAALDLPAFHRLDVASQRGVIRCAWNFVGGASDALGFDHIERMRTHLLGVTGSAGPFPIAGGIAWSVVGSLFSLHHEHGLPLHPNHPFLDGKWRAAHLRMELSVPGVIPVDGWRLRVESMAISELPTDWRKNDDPWQAYLDRDAIGELLLTTPQPGQRVAPLGMGGQRKSLGDLFTDRKIPPSLRSGWPLIVDGSSDEVLWVCGIQPAHAARITEQTEQVLHLRWEQVQIAGEDDP